MKLLDKLKQNMNRWLFNDREALFEALEPYIVEIAGKVGLSPDFIESFNGKPVNQNIDKNEIALMVDAILTISKEHPNHKVGGQPFRCSALDLTTQIEKFLTVYNYDLQTIYEAFVLYLSEVYDGRDNSKMTTLYYFVMKQGAGSRLATYCDMILSGEQEESSSFMLKL